MRPGCLPLGPSGKRATIAVPIFATTSPRLPEWPYRPGTPGRSPGSSTSGGRFCRFDSCVHKGELPHRVLRGRASTQEMGIKHRRTPSLVVSIVAGVMTGVAAFLVAPRSCDVGGGIDMPCEAGPPPWTNAIDGVVLDRTYAGIPVLCSGSLRVRRPHRDPSRAVAVGTSSTGPAPRAWSSAHTENSRISRIRVNDQVTPERQASPGARHVRWALRGSNPRPSPCKGDALPAELSARASDSRRSGRRATG